MDTIIRQYETADLEELLDTWEVATRLAHKFVTDDIVEQERKKFTDIQLPNTDTWVAEVEGKVIGFITLAGNEICAFGLQPEYHGKRVGKALMDKAQQLHGDLEVEVFEDNVIGRMFYSKYGFEPLEEKFHDRTRRALLRLRFTAGEDDIP